jgi:soluble cytochrome b562
MEKLNEFERVILSCNQTSYLASQLQMLQLQLAMANFKDKNEFIEKRIKDIDSFINRLSEQSIDILNEIADYMNGMDAVTDIDCHLFDNLFNELNKEY